MSVQPRSIILAFLLAVLFQVLQPSDALRNKPSYPSAAALASTRGGDIGGNSDEDRKKTFEELIRKAQFDPNVILNDETHVLSSLGRFLSVPGPLPDLMSTCTMAAVYQSDIFKDGIEAGKEAYANMKVTFAQEYEEALAMGGVEISEEEQSVATTAESQSSVMIQKCIEFLGSDYMHANFFSAENFRQQVLKSPFWQGLVKASLITHLGEECPNFEELLQDGGLWSSTLQKCI